MLSASKSGSGAVSGYNLTRSLRFRRSATAYLNRTPASAGNRKTWTWSAWFKRGSISGVEMGLFDAVASSGTDSIGFRTDETLTMYFANAANGNLTTTQVFRDPSAWYHIVIALDTTQATASNRVKIYLNGTQITAFTTSSYPAQNLDCGWNNSVAQNIGRKTSAADYFDGYLTEVNFIDGQALTPSSFGSTNALTGVWQPAAYTGSYGTNGFELQFTDNSAATAAAIGKDSSGNGNNWTPNNISITAGVTYDSMTDVPTLTSATAANFAVLNPLKNYNNTIVDGNLNISSTSASTTTIVLATIGMSTGKWYWEFTQTSFTVINSPMIGVAKDSVSMTAYVGSDANGWGYYGTGDKYNNGVGTAYGATYTNNDVMGVAFDATAGTLVFYKNNSSQGTAFTGLTSGPYFPAFSDGGSTAVMTANVNFGQRPFTYTPPTGFVALNTYNLPTSTILKGNTVMDATLYTGTGAIQSITNAGGFKPDLLWVKGRSRVSFHDLVDSVRGVNLALSSNSTNAEIAGSFITSLNSNGFTLPANTTSDTYFTNVSGDTMVGWQWQAGQGTTSSNANGTITSTVSVNASAGFSVVTYTGTNTGTPSPMPTVGHGLGVAPSLVISKSRNLAGVDSGAWFVWISAQATDNYLRLNTTAASASISGGGGGTMVAPTSSVFSTPYVSGSNINANNYVAYCWTPIAGFSAFGSYTGNGSATGPFIYTGFQPKFILIKSTTAARDWIIWDTARNTFNIGTAGVLFPNTSGAEYSGGGAYSVAVTSNGFYLPVSTANLNASGETHIYAAFATTPFRNSLAF